MRTLTISALALCACALITGCDGAQEIADKKIRFATSTALAAAEKDKNPLAAFLRLESAKDAVIDIEHEANKRCPYEGLFHGNCVSSPDLKDISAAQVKYIGTAIEQGDSSALARLYSPITFIGDENVFSPLRTHYMPLLLSTADKGAGRSPLEIVLNLRAGEATLGGQYAVRDTERAVGYFARAWAAGDVQTADTIADVFQKLGDDRNTYLWALRCTDGCKRNSNLDLDSLQQKLSPEASKQAQQAAATPSVIELATGE